MRSRRIAELRREIAGGARRPRPPARSRSSAAGGPAGEALWLLRHAKSSWDEPGLADHDRPLAPRGRKAAKRIRRWAAEHDVRPDLVLCSTAVRARATLELVCRRSAHPQVEIEDGLYHAWADDLLERLRASPADVDGVLVIGHNPGLARPRLRCSRHPGPRRSRPEPWQSSGSRSRTGAMSRPGCAELVQLVLPRQLPG